MSEAWYRGGTENPDFTTHSDAEVEGSDVRQREGRKGAVRKVSQSFGDGGCDLCRRASLEHARFHVCQPVVDNVVTPWVSRAYRCFDRRKRRKALDVHDAYVDSGDVAFDERTVRVLRKYRLENLSQRDWILYDTVLADSLP